MKNNINRQFSKEGIHKVSSLYTSKTIPIKSHMKTNHLFRKLKFQGSFLLIVIPRALKGTFSYICKNV